MIALADSSALYALYDSSDENHIAFLRLFQSRDLSIVVPSVVLPEAAGLMRRYLGVAAEKDLLDGLAAGFYQVEPLADKDLARARVVARLHDGLNLVDAMIVAIAERLGSRTLLTTDERDFRPLPLTILPADL